MFPPIWAKMVPPGKPNPPMENLVSKPIGGNFPPTVLLKIAKPKFFFFSPQNTLNTQFCYLKIFFRQGEKI